MKILCPQCDFTGEISDAAIPPEGKHLTCPKCKHRFLVKKGLPETETISAAPPPPVYAPSTKQIVKNPVHIEVLDSAIGSGCKVEILQYEKIEGSKDIATAEALYYANKSGLKLKQVKVTISNSEVILKAGALHYMKGAIVMESKLGGKKGLKSKFLAQETAYKPKYTGTGEIFMEPSFGHYIIYRLNNESLTVNKGMFFCCEASVDIDIVMIKNVSAALFGGEGLFQTNLTGAGFAVLESPVPLSEVKRIDLTDDKLSIDGNFALMWTGGVAFTMERSSRSFLGSATSGEGLLQTFTGTGSVWIAPTQSIYSLLKSPFAGPNVIPSSKSLLGKKLTQ